MNGCARQNQIDFSSSKAFFSSLNKTEIVKKENKNSTALLNNLKKSQITNKDDGLIKKSLLLNLSSYEKLLEQKIGIEEYKILKIFNDENFIISNKDGYKITKKK